MVVVVVLLVSQTLMCVFHLSVAVSAVKPTAPAASAPADIPSLGARAEQGNPGDLSSLLGAGSTRGRRPLTFPFVIGVVIHIATTPIVYFNVYLYLFFFF